MAICCETRVRKMKRGKIGRTLLLLACAALLADPAAGWAQSAGGGGRGRRGDRGNGPEQAAAPLNVPVATKPPRVRLEPGALLCRTEEDLQGHQAAVAARLDGHPTQEPGGCHRLSAITAVSVVERHGPARTEVRLPDPAETVGWTDAVVPN